MVGEVRGRAVERLVVSMVQPARNVNPEPTRTIMSSPVRHLPVEQQWDCHGCAKCCHEYRVTLSEEERERIARQGWERDPQFGASPWFKRRGPWWRRRYELAKHDDGSCIFLSSKGRCLIHERFGAEAKPLACRIFPFVLIPAGDHWRAGVRFACPSAAANRGRALPEHEVQQYADLWAQQRGVDPTAVPPPRLQGRQRVAWPDLIRFVDALLGIVLNRRDRIDRRLRKCLTLSRVCRQARFDQLRGDRLGELLDVLCTGLDTEVNADPASLSPPSWIGKILFRQLAALYLRQDHGPERGQTSGSLLARIRANWRFACGKGPVPRVNALLPETTFARLEEQAGVMPDDGAMVLERYYRVKIGSLQFCGPSNFGRSFWDGLESLLATFPLICWTARALADQPRVDALIAAVRVVDTPFGYNRLLGSRRQRLGVRLLAHTGELDKLIAWYSR